MLYVNRVKCLKNILNVLTFILSLTIAHASYSQDDPAKPSRGGTALNPYWIYQAEAIAAVNASKGYVERSSFNVTKAKISGWVNGPVLKICQPRFNGKGTVTASIRILVRMLDAASSAPTPIFLTELEATTSDGQSVSNIIQYQYDQLNFYNELFLTSTPVIEIPDGASNVCLSIHVYPNEFLSPGQTNPYIKEMWVSSASISMNSNPVQ